MGTGILLSFQAWMVGDLVQKNGTRGKEEEWTVPPPGAASLIHKGLQREN